MVNLGFDAFATFVVIVAPIAIVLFLILVVVAYPWLLLVPLGIWYLTIKYGPDDQPEPRKDSVPIESTPADGESVAAFASTSTNADDTVLS